MLRRGSIPDRLSTFKMRPLTAKVTRGYDWQGRFGAQLEFICNSVLQIVKRMLKELGG